MTYEFFEKNRVLFGSDAPMDRSIGEIFTQETKRSVEKMTISGMERRQIFNENILNLLHRA